MKHDSKSEGTHFIGKVSELKSSYHHNLSIMDAISTNKSASNDENAVDD